MTRFYDTLKHINSYQQRFFTHSIAQKADSSRNKEIINFMIKKNNKNNKPHHKSKSLYSRAFGEFIKSYTQKHWAIIKYTDCFRVLALLNKWRQIASTTVRAYISR